MLHSVLWSSGQYVSRTKDLLADLSLILTQMDSGGRNMKPWKIAVIVVSVIIGLTLIIGLITYFLCHYQDRYYSATFLITNVPYDVQYEKQTTEEFRYLSQEIETMMSRVFRGSFLSRKYVRSHVVTLSPDPGGVLVSVALVFKFTSADSRETSWRHVDSVLQRRLETSSTFLKVDPSSIKLIELNKENGDNLLNNFCGIRDEAFSFSGVERITDGQRAQDGEWPWQASIQLDGTHYCGASVISNTWLVTAAHCFKAGRDPRRWTASFGILLRPPKQKKYVRRIIIHEKYNGLVPDHEYDIAVVELASPIEFTSDVHSVCLPEASYVFRDNISCFVTGWGALKNDGPSVNQLRQAEVRIISTAICNRPRVYAGAITPGMLCAGYLEGQVDACQGDSGGPLVNANSRGIWYLVGIVSWGDECGKPDKPGVYTRVTFYRDWIASKTGI
ncbi:transmembrane protease serine 11E [Cyrtonyx montezumae]|uniref:transmembrane protease serine 11E n=1 Tax=Cyrtonyx montezumae TaxID=9017 RepID=UPI0032DA4372